MLREKIKQRYKIHNEVTTFMAKIFFKEERKQNKQHEHNHTLAISTTTLFAL